MTVSSGVAGRRFQEFAASNSITVLIPARNEESTVGAIVSALVERYVSRELVKEVVVIDDHCVDGTAAAASKSGARIVRRLGSKAPAGKAEAILDGIGRYPSDVYVLFDADITNFEARWLELLCEKLTDPRHLLVKGTYSRPIADSGRNHGRFLEGGRVTELVARPLLSIFFPPLARLGQPLSGEMAFRSTLLSEKVRLSPGYGFDVGLLIDCHLNFGTGSICEADLGSRSHRHQDLTSLSYQASQVATTILLKAGVDVEGSAGAGKLYRPGKGETIIPYRPLLLE